MLGLVVFTVVEVPVQDNRPAADHTPAWAALQNTLSQASRVFEPGTLSRIPVLLDEQVRSNILVESIQNRRRIPALRSAVAVADNTLVAHDAYRAAFAQSRF